MAASSGHGIISAMIQRFGWSMQQRKIKKGTALGEAVAPDRTEGQDWVNFYRSDDYVATAHFIWTGLSMTSQNWDR